MALGSTGAGGISAANGGMILLVEDDDIFFVIFIIVRIVFFPHESGHGLVQKNPAFFFGLGWEGAHVLKASVFERLPDENRHFLAVHHHDRGGVFVPAANQSGDPVAQFGLQMAE